jgi:coenzyme PQQ precursor peptide PqqA
MAPRKRDQDNSRRSKENLIGFSRTCDLNVWPAIGTPQSLKPVGDPGIAIWRRYTMKTWTKPAVREQEVGLEVTSCLPAEIDVI